MVKRKAKKIIVMVLVLAFVMSIVCSVYAEKELVVDQAGVFTGDETVSLREAAKVLGNKYAMDIIIVTTSDAGGKSSRSYADDYFDYNGYGIGEDRDGILLLLDYDNREAYISTSGSGIRYLTDIRIESILDDVFDGGLAEGDNYGAAEAFLESTEVFLAYGIPEDKISWVTAFSAYSGKELLVDQAKLFTEEEADILRKGVKDLSDRYYMDVAIVTTNDAKGKDTVNYAQDYFISNDYGVGLKSDGILFLMDYDNNQACIYTSGSGTSYLTSERVNKIMEIISDRGLTKGDNFKASAAFLEAVGDYLLEGIPVEEIPEKEIPEEQHTLPEPVPNSLSAAEAIAGAIISGIIGLIFFSATKNGYEGYPEPVEFEFRRNSITNLDIMEDSLVNSYITTRIIPEPEPKPKPEKREYSISIRSTESRRDSGRNTTHISSSGKSHGGGGRSFAGGSTTHRSSSGRSHGGGGRKF